MSCRIFISYSRKDKHAVFPFKEEIERYTGPGTCWIDYSGIESDQQFEDVIISAIERTDIFLYMHSKNSDSSRWMRKEIDYAALCNKRIVIVQTDDSPFAKWFLFNYQKQQRTLLSSPEQKRRLLEDLASWTGHHPPQPYPKPVPDPEKRIAANKPSRPAGSINIKLLLKIGAVILMILILCAGGHFIFEWIQNNTGQETDPATPTPVFRDETITVKGVSFKMIAVQGGPFSMGSDSGKVDEKPVHEVSLSSYHICEAEVTQQLWRTVMATNPSRFKGLQNPVEDVSLEDCQEFIKKLNSLTGKQFRLPTEAEWEYAARGGNKSNRYKYSGSDDIETVAWYRDNSGSKTHPVKTKSPNELGIYDMSGNVMEWCSDCYGAYPSFPVTNPKGPSSDLNRIFRGGSWFSDDSICRVSQRNRLVPSSRGSGLGLRLAM